MSNPENDDFEQSLRDATYIPDDGFAQRVLEQLPASAARTRKRKIVLTTAFTLAGTIFAYQAVALAIALIKSGALSAANTARWDSLLMNPLVLLGGVALAVVLGFLSTRLLAYLDENLG